ncbi:NUDIX domain-containing protein [Amycolatopsis sp. OK19-0408]|uniref:NUDIX domain-containing protein n=1 Tax=Amycolatopsis iheyensis TaxID=2945988 RepID=A0A9X2NHI6_9PSEU|nr:NUDIX domain-containing protein [Amycolatopsis iheyensis]MCR6487338.1 NUDIX domain-containing protein [Amycolatopsis iheyensis]
MTTGPIQIYRYGEHKDLGHFLICAGYLVENDLVLLVHHNGFDKWVPPGGHIEAGETFAETAVREFGEETGLQVEALSAGPEIHPADNNATPEPIPFYVDLEREGFKQPALVQFFFMRRTDRSSVVTPQLSEVYDARWFALDEINNIKTFDQVRSLAKYAIRNHPDSTKNVN